MTERFSSVEQLKEYNAERPYVYLGRYLRVVFLKSLRREVPVCPCALGGEIHAGFVSLHHFAEPEIQHFDNSLIEHDITGLQVVVDDFLFQLKEVVEGREELPHNQFGLLLF